ncbi:hypothetical protein LSH36_25g09066 [Paralvinella palmiformis]|uniref:MULE transposase domain-containing protein n=1 Tax=Paralvinella palmiformis TaxID=53620 RepID=A0AAD9KC34_9ANNE|nr:hypothetical protein LSH36_25g09066 [Paralvinella palmiformis]
MHKGEMTSRVGKHETSHRIIDGEKWEVQSPYTSMMFHYLCQAIVGFRFASIVDNCNSSIVPCSNTDNHRQLVYNTRTTGSEIVNKAIKDNFPPTAPTDHLPQHASLVCGANRHRQGDRSRNPQDLDFEVQNSAIPDDFLRGDIQQVPDVFALISGATTDDYKAVLEHIIKDIQVIMNFERAAWSAVHTVLPQVTCSGCHFHWTQAIWRKVQSLGLTADYMEKSQVQKFVRCLMCLPFLPHANIVPMFVNIISLDIPANPMPPMLHQLLDYIQRTWIYSNVWHPEFWSQSQRSVRTNNDCEGWHRKLNCKLQTRSTLLPNNNRSAQ